MRYVVFCDLANATESKIHPASCQHYKNRKRDATSTKWSREFDSKEEAIRDDRSIS